MLSNKESFTAVHELGEHITLEPSGAGRPFERALALP